MLPGQEDFAPGQMLGSGAEGEVFEAMLQLPLAVKFVSPLSSSTPRFLFVCDASLHASSTPSPSVSDASQSAALCEQPAGHEAGGMEPTVSGLLMETCMAAQGPIPARVYEEAANMGRFRSRHVVAALAVAESADGCVVGIVMPKAQYGTLLDFLRCVRNQHGPHSMCCAGCAVNPAATCVHGQHVRHGQRCHADSRPVLRHGSPGMQHCLCRESTLGVEARLEWVRQMVQGLLAVRAAGFMHGDIKPDNLLVFEEAGELVVKLGDLGLMVPLDPATGRTRLGVWRCAPEHTLNPAPRITTLALHAHTLYPACCPASL